MKGIVLFTVLLLQTAFTVFSDEDDSSSGSGYNDTDIHTSPSLAATLSISSTITSLPSPTRVVPPSTNSSLSVESRLILYITIPPLCLLVVIVLIVSVVLYCRRYRRIKRMRLHLMPLHNMDGSDEEEEEEDYDDDEFDREAAFTISSTEGRQPILQFAET